MIDDVSLFGEETAAQIYEMLKDIAEYDTQAVIRDLFNIRESVIISAVNKINAFVEETDSEFQIYSETWTELKSLYLYGKGYKETSDERRRRWSAYHRFAYELAKRGELAENLDLTRDAAF